MDILEDFEMWYKAGRAAYRVTCVLWFCRHYPGLFVQVLLNKEFLDAFGVP